MFRLYSFKYTRLFAFELLIALPVFIGKIDSELQMVTVYATVRMYRPRANAEHALKNSDLIEFESPRTTAAGFRQGSGYQGFAAACYTFHQEPR